MTFTAPWKASEPVEIYAPQSVIATPWGSPQVSSLRGRTLASNSHFIAIMGETPISWQQRDIPLDKKQLERIHLSKLANDCWVATGQDLYDEISSESESPDFQVLIDGEITGWEMTQFAVSDRRLAHQLFYQLTDRLKALPIGKLRHLRGYQVIFWFAGEIQEADGLPLKFSDSVASEKLIEALAAFRPNVNDFAIATDEPGRPKVPTPIEVATGINLLAVPLIGSVPSTPDFAETLINLGLYYQTEHHAMDEWSKLQGRISRKDRPGNDYVVISAGAPDRMGRCFLAEEVLAQFLIDHPATLRAEHLKAVIIHFWSTGSAYELLDNGPRLLWRGPYEAAVPSHQVFSDTSPDQAQEAPAFLDEIT